MSKKYDELKRQVTSRRELPEAELYVTARDRYLSEWACLDGKHCRHIFPAVSFEEAQIIKRNLEHREEMEIVYINQGKPKMRHRRNVYVLTTKDDAPDYYERGGFIEPSTLHSPKGWAVHLRSNRSVRIEPAQWLAQVVGPNGHANHTSPRAAYDKVREWKKRAEGLEAEGLGELAKLLGEAQMLLADDGAS